MRNTPAVIVLLLYVLIAGGFDKPASSVTGAWHSKKGETETVLIYQDGYFVHTMFNQAGRSFIFSSGGTYTEKKGQLICRVEFDTKEKMNVGTEQIVDLAITGDKMIITGNDGMKRELNRLDNGTGVLAGNWRITGRMQGEKMNTIQAGPRKTLKILSGTRFQWMAINTETKDFFGTGGGTYTFREGKYTENIEFFSRDSSRVGASLTFDGSVSGNIWTHKGLSSKGDPIHEEWTRE
ncbi:MAG: hypothetical protein JNK14_14120 [Chitinophagaceae bacterium]|nr:hypothetical protein [Chitinophagaceae bacterium]